MLNYFWEPGGGLYIPCRGCASSAVAVVLFFFRGAVNRCALWHIVFRRSLGFEYKKVIKSHCSYTPVLPLFDDCALYYKCRVAAIAP